MGISTIQSIEIDRNYAKPAFGCVKLCRNLTVTIVDPEPVYGGIDVYCVTCSVTDSFECSVDSVERQGDPEDTSMWTPTDDLVADLVAEYYNT